MDSFFVHSSSFVDAGAIIGEGTRIWHFCHIMPGAIIGKNCSIGQNVFIGQCVTLGDGCKLQNNLDLPYGVTLEDNVFVGPGAIFTNVLNPRSHVERKDEYMLTLVKQGATIGGGAVIVCGNTLGRYCIVGAGAVVTHDVPDYALVYGNPARQMGWVCQCGEKLSPDHTCPRCKAIYRIKDFGLHPIT